LKASSRPEAILFLPNTVSQATTRNTDFQQLAKDKKLNFFFFFFWWGLLHGPQQGPDRMKEKTYNTGKRKNPA